MCWPEAKLESLCSWKEREQKPAKEGGKGFEGEERKRRAGIREGERRRESEEFGAAQPEPEMGVRKQTNVAFRCIPSSGYLVVQCEHPAPGGTGPGALHVLRAQDRSDGMGGGARVFVVGREGMEGRYERGWVLGTWNKIQS